MKSPRRSFPKCLPMLESSSRCKRTLVPWAKVFSGYQAARLIREGIAQDIALKSITTWPAEIMGLADQLGSLEEGRHGNVLILSGHPLAQSTLVEHVVIEGKVAYDRTEDRRLKKLLSGEDQPPADSE